MYVVTVTFTLHRDQAQAFLPLMLAQARNSLTDEPGCQVFDVCRDAQAPTKIFLYEVYDDLAAFEAHLASDHYRAFDAAVADMVAEKRIECFERLDPAI